MNRIASKTNDNVPTNLKELFNLREISSTCHTLNKDEINNIRKKANTSNI